MKTAEQLVQDIRQVFADVPFPSHLGLHAAMAMDDWIVDEAVLREITRQKDYNGNWWDVPIDHLLNSTLPLSYLDVAGVDFYLPAYMTLVIQMPESSICRHIMYFMCPHDDVLEEGQSESDGLRQYFYDRFSNIRDEKKRVSLRFLKYVAGCGEYDDWTREDASAALNDEFWAYTDSVND